MSALIHRWSRPHVFICLTLAFAAQAQSQSVWNTTTGDWSTAANWSPAVVLTSGGATTLVFGGSGGYTTTNDLGDFSLNQLVFNHSAGTVTLNGSPTTNALVFGNSSAALPAITLTGPGNTTISAPVTWNGNTAVTHGGAGTLTFSGTQTYANGTKQTFTNAGGGTLTLADGITYATAGSGTGLVLNLINHNSVAGSFNIGDVGGLGNATFNIGGTGAVRFNGGSANDLFASSAVLNVLGGATFDFNANPETMGAISGSGTIRQAGLTTQATGYFVFSGKMTGTGTGTTLTVAASAHTLVLSGAENEYEGFTTITAGRLIVAANAPAGSAGALGNATSDVRVGNTSGTSNATLMIGGAGVSIGRNVRLQSGNTGVGTVGGLNTSGTATYSGNLILGTDSAAAKGVTLFAAKGGTVEFTGNLLRAASATGDTDALTVNGGGIVALRGANTFTGATRVNAGTLLLDHAANNATKLSSTAALTLCGGSVSLAGNAAGATTQFVSALNLGNSVLPLGGGARILVTSGADQNATLSLGAITRNTGATVDFALVNTGSGVAGITTSTANIATGILGGYATFQFNDWAVNDGLGNIAALDAGSYTTAFGTGLHTSLGVNTALTSGGATTGTLRFTSATALTFNSGTPGTLALESGGILVASTAGATSIGSTTTRGTISTTANELIIHQQSTAGALTINSVISGTNLTKSGNGTLVLTGTNTYTGNTIINGGSVSVTAARNLGEITADVTINGGTLVLASGTLGTNLTATGRVITVGPAGATFHFTANQSFSGSGLAGTGTLTLTGSGIVSFGSNESTFNGDIVINNGAVRMNSPQLDNVASITVNSGGTYEVNDDATDTFSLAAGGRFLINGNGLGGNGALRLTDQTGSTTRFDPRTTINREVVLETTSRIQVANGTAAGSLSQLTLTGNVTGAGGLVKTGNGLLILTARDNTYSGSTSIEAGTLRINLGNDRLPTGTMVTLGAGSSSGVLQLNGYSQTIAGLTTAGTGTANAVTNGSATTTSLLTVNVAAGTQTYAGILGGTGSVNTHTNNNLAFIKEGAGTGVLAGSNTHNGETVVKNGVLALGHVNALGSGGASLSEGLAGTTVLAGATLDLNGQAQVNEIITLSGSGAGGGGALVNNSTTAASLGSGIASLSFSGVSTSGWSAGASITIDAPGAGTPAAATALLGLSQASVTLTNGGSGFGLAPVVNVTGGSGAVVTAAVGVTNASYTITGGTTVYSTAPTVTLQNGATATAILSGGSTGTVTGINVTSPGSGAGFGATPTITFSGGVIETAGTAPTGTGNNNNYTIISLNIVNPGSGFTSTPTFTITGGAGAAAVGNDGNFVLNGIAITESGSGYTSAPAMSISGGTAAATANLSAVVLDADSSIGGSGDLVVNSVITGDHALTKVGAGRTTLNADNTYGGTTTVTAGNLQVGTAGVGSTGAGHLTVNGGGAVLSGTGSVAAATTTVISGTIKPGDSGGSATGTLNTQNLTFTPAAAMTVAELQITGSTANSNLAHDKISITGDLTLSSLGSILVDGSSYTAAVGDAFELLDWSGLLTGNGFSTGDNLRTGANAALNEGNLDLPDISGTGLWQIAFGSGSLMLTVVAVPEPGRAMLLVLGLVSLVSRRRRVS